MKATQEICPEYYPLLLMAVRTGLRRGELVALQWGDLLRGRDDDHSNRFILVQHNDVRCEHTTTKSKKARRVDLSRELRRVFVEPCDKPLFEAYLAGQNDISDELVFRSPEKAIIDPDNHCHRISRCWPRPESARFAFMISVTHSGRCSSRAGRRSCT